MRDLRDPQILGQVLAENRESWAEKRKPLSQIHTWVEKHGRTVADVSKDDSMGKACVREYRAELEARREEGDRYAASALESINQGLGVQGFDDAGS